MPGTGKRHVRFRGMPKYHLNIFNAVDTYDEEGLELPDLAAAKKAAINGARHLMAEHIVAGRPLDLSDRIEIADERGSVLATLPFREMITIIDR